jgi:hypothetical protein
MRIQPPSVETELSAREETFLSHLYTLPVNTLHLFVMFETLVALGVAGGEIEAVAIESARNATSSRSTLYIALQGPTAQS